MTFSPSPDDRPDPADQHAVRARVPEHVSRGVFSTGVIVMTAPTEFVIDFIQNLGRPHQVVARIVMPHPVLPQFVDALLKNIELYRGRYGNLPQPNLAGIVVTTSPAFGAPEQPPTVEEQLPRPPSSPNQAGSGSDLEQLGSSTSVVGPGIAPTASAADAINAGRVEGGRDEAGRDEGGRDEGGRDEGGRVEGGRVEGGRVEGGRVEGGLGSEAEATPQPGGQGSLPHTNMRRATAQEIYDDLKMRDEILSGSYANAVMIGHGPHEFSFDFITNFYPNSAVSARVFLAAGQVARLADSLRGAWEQIRHRFPPPPDSDNPPRRA